MKKLFAALGICFLLLLTSSPAHAKEIYVYTTYFGDGSHFTEHYIDTEQTYCKHYKHRKEIYVTFKDYDNILGYPITTMPFPMFVYQDEQWHFQYTDMEFNLLDKMLKILTSPDVWDEIDENGYEVARKEREKEEAEAPQIALRNRDSGDASYKAKNYKSAIDCYNEAIKYNPHDPVSYFKRGNTYKAMKDYNHAVEDYKKALELDPNYEEVIKTLQEMLAAHNHAEINAAFERGQKFYKNKDFDNAIKEFERIIELDPNNVAAYNNRAYVYASKNDYTHAVDDYSRVIELDPKNAVAYNDRGYVNYMMHNYDLAIADYDKALQLDQNYVLTYCNRGSAYSVKRDFDRAIEDFTHAIKLDPKNVIAYLWRGCIYGNKGDYKRATADFKKVLEIEPNNQEAQQYLQQVMNKKEKQ